MTEQMKLWKRLKRMKIVKAEKIYEAAVYKEKLDVAKSKVVEFMVSDIQKQMQAHLANKFKNLGGDKKVKKQKKLVAPIGNKLKAMHKNMLDTIVEEGSAADLDNFVQGNGPQENFMTPLPKKAPGRKMSSVEPGTPNPGSDIDDSELFKLAELRHK